MAKKELVKAEFTDISKTIKKYGFCQWYVFFSERSNGKSYSALRLVFDEFIEFGYQFAYIKRWDDLITQSKLDEVFSHLEDNAYHKNQIAIDSKNKYNHVSVKSKKFYVEHIADKDDEADKDYKCDDVFGYAFAINKSDSYKSTSYPKVKTIIVEEFIAEDINVVNEWIKLCSIISTIIRTNDDVKIILLGNTINPYNIYFDEMGLFKAQFQERGTSDIYKNTYKYYDDNNKLCERDMYVCCTRCQNLSKTIKKGDFYFAFNKSPELAMITDGAWQLPNYQHLTHTYRPKNIKLKYYIKLNNDLFEANIIMVKDTADSRIDELNYEPTNKNFIFTYVHKKTTPLKYNYNDIVYQKEPSTHPNVFNSIMARSDDVGNFIKWFYMNNKVCYQDNMVGIAIENFIKSS